MLDIEQQTLYDYTSLDTDTATYLKQNAHETRGLLTRTSDDIIQIGRNLLEAKYKFSGKGNKGKFIPWVKAELGISQQTSWRFMQIAQGKSVKSLTVSDLIISPPVEPVEQEDKVRIRTPEKDDEKREKVIEFFAEFPHLQALSNREIGKRCEVAEGTVRKYRKELQAERQRELPELTALDTLIETLPEPSFEPEIEPTTIEPEPEPQPVAQVQPEVEPAPVVAVTVLETKTEPTPEIEQEPELETEQQSPPVIEAIPATAATPSVPVSPPKLPRIEASEEVQLERDIRRQEKQEQNEQLKEKGVELPQGKYACLVIDPPWQMQKIERDERPNQFEFDYPTMTEEELKKFPLPDMAADNCHLYLWTTQKHLPLALRLAEHWGFTYQCLMTWVKNVGFTPFSWMYSTEHVIFCTRGSLSLLEIGRRLDFSAKVREHSRKPDEFYDIVKEVSPSPRIDIFSREKRDGFEQYGNEAEKYVQG